MDDIVWRLRRAAVGLPQDEMNQTAADEIERLRAEINGLVSASEAWGRVLKLEAEIGRLQAAGDAMAENYAAQLATRWSAFNHSFLTAWREARRHETSPSGA